MSRVTTTPRSPSLAVLAAGAALTLAVACGQAPSFKESASRHANGHATTAQGQDGLDATVKPDGADAGDGGSATDAGGADAGKADAGKADAGGADGGGVAAKNPPGVDDPAVIANLKRLPKFGLLVNDMECGVCHTTVIGEVLSTRDVPPLWFNSDLKITGRWMAAAAFKANVPACADPGCLGQGVTVSASAVLPNYRGAELPLDRDGDGKPDFPTMDFAALPKLMRGSVKTSAGYPANVDKVWTGNLVLVGTKDQPIVLKDDVFVAGDLVITGVYSGTGSIYVAGNIYIPADLQAARSGFPYAADETAALAQAQAQVAAQSTDALGLATAKSIFIGDLEKHQNSDVGNELVNVYNHPSTPANRRGEALGVLDIFTWFPGGRAGYDTLYREAVSCVTGQATQIGSFNLLEAFLYARNTVAGISRRASYSIRGGVIADYFHVVSGAARCDATPSAVHGRPANRNYIEYDYRLKTGLLRLLEHVGEAFPAAP